MLDRLKSVLLSFQKCGLFFYNPGLAFQKHSQATMSNVAKHRELGPNLHEQIFHNSDFQHFLGMSKYQVKIPLLSADIERVQCVAVSIIFGNTGYAKASAMLILLEDF